MAIKDLNRANGSGTPDPQEAASESREALSLSELASRQQAAMAQLKETTSAYDTLLEETVKAVDENIIQSKKMTDEVKNQAAVTAAVMLAEAEKIISEADREGRTQAREAMRKVSDLIEAARSSAGRVARPDREQLPWLTGEIWTALEASIEQSLQSVLKDLQTLEQETKLSEGQGGPQGESREADPDSATSEHSENKSELQHSNGFKAEMDDSVASSATGQGATKPGVDDSQGDGDKEPGSTEKRYGMDTLLPIVRATRFYKGNVILVMLLKKASWDEKPENPITPDQISRQIKNTPGGSVANSGMVGKEYFIEALFETPVSLAEVLDGVSDWEDFEDQGDRVKNYQRRALSVFPSTSSKESKDAKRILVTL